MKSRYGNAGEQLDLRSASSRRGRPAPGDFDEMFIVHGWSGVADHFRCHPRSVKRWLVQRGEERLVAARARYVEAARSMKRQAKVKSARTACPISDTPLLIPPMPPQSEMT